MHPVIGVNEGVVAEVDAGVRDTFRSAGAWGAAEEHEVPFSEL
jgi:hypothetical protein